MADLSKFGVALDGNKLGILQPKQQFKFRVIFLGIGFDADSRVLTQNIVTVTRPTVEAQMTELHSYNSIGYIQGKAVWSPVEITLRDDLTNGVVSVLGQQQQKQFNHFEQTTPGAGANYKFTTEIHSLLGNNGEELERWVLDGCFIMNYSTPGGDYASSDSNIVTLSLRYDVATHIAGPNTNDGTTVGGDPFPNVPSGTGLVNFG